MVNMRITGRKKCKKGRQSARPPKPTTVGKVGLSQLVHDSQRGQSASAHLSLSIQMCVCFYKKERGRDVKVWPGI